MATKSGHARRKFSVGDRQIQQAVVWRLVMHVGAYLLATAVLGMVLTFLANPFQDPAWYSEVFWRSQGPNILVLLAMLPMIFWDTFKLTNRIVGPVCRLRTTLRRLNSGETPPALSFRQADFWQDLPDEFNALVERLREAERAPGEGRTLEEVGSP